MNIFTILLMPFLGTSLGACSVLFMKSSPDARIHKILLGFASGVMIAASVWSLLLPSIEMANTQGIPSFIPPSAGFMLGTGFMLLLDKLTPLIKRTGRLTLRFGKTSTMILAVTIHNIPEGMAVGVALAGALSGNSGMTIAGAFALSLGIAVQNYPEGAIVSLPLSSNGMSRSKALLFGIISGAVEPLAAAAALALSEASGLILPYFLSFAAGAMIYVTAGDLIPEAHSDKKATTATLSVAAGFLIMMVLDVALG